MQASTLELELVPADAGTPDEPAAVASPVTHARSSGGSTAEPRSFAGFRLTTLALVAVIGALLGWNAWMTREIVGLRRHKIVSVSLASIITDFVHDQSRQQGTPEEAAARTRVYLAATQKALLDLARSGTAVVASEAVLANSVPDDTAAVKTAVARALAAQPTPAGQQ